MITQEDYNKIKEILKENNLNYIEVIGILEAIKFDTFQEKCYKEYKDKLENDA